MSLRKQNLRSLQNFNCLQQAMRQAAKPTQRVVSFASVTLAAAPLPPLRVAKRLRRSALPVCDSILFAAISLCRIGAGVFGTLLQQDG